MKIKYIFDPWSKNRLHLKFHVTRLKKLKIYNMRKSSIKLWILTVLTISCYFTTFAQQVDLEKLKGINVRSIGPAGMSGRVTAIDVVHNQPQIMYVGSASGGCGNPKVEVWIGSLYLIKSRFYPLVQSLFSKTIQM